ncbi:hypothetical protein DN062_09040 [Nitrincola tibetensis]|uniref:Uncharacterized protein n=1 Tax=Nitrincola tibetensis TaxID=2219697 RepID=A0A364NMT6_9GAMM|nr:hypothetical protein [Nitrincola tibetensis]RAU18362.1 hypothetical protein DN062_09040 [Nitrincola tibetensis]
MRTVKWVFAFLGLMVAFVLMAYGLYWYQLKRELDSTLNGLNPLLQVSYNRLVLSPFGEVKIQGIRIMPLGQASPFLIDTLLMRSRDPAFWLNPGATLNRESVPNDLHVSMTGLTLDFNSPLFTSFEHMAKQLMSDSPPSHISPIALGCGNVRSFDLTTLRMIGMRLVQTDFYFNWQRLDENRVQLDVNANVKDWWQIDFSAVLGLTLRQASNLREVPGVLAAELRYSDEGFNRRRGEFCSTQSQVSPAQFYLNHGLMIQDWLRERGVEPTRPMIAGYDAMSRPDAQLEISLSPTELVIPLTFARSHEPADYVGLLRPSIKVNDTHIELTDDEWVALFEAFSMQIEVPEAELPELNPRRRSMPVEAENIFVPRQFRETDTSEFFNYVGHPVRFYTFFGKRVEGILVAVEGNNIRVIERVDRGVAEYPFELDKIQATEVYR